jgi:hypothetical protein
MFGLSGIILAVIYLPQILKLKNSIPKLILPLFCLLSLVSTVLEFMLPNEGIANDGNVYNAIVYLIALFGTIAIIIYIEIKKYKLKNIKSPYLKDYNRYIDAIEKNAKATKKQSQREIMRSENTIQFVFDHIKEKDKALKFVLDKGIESTDDNVVFWACKHSVSIGYNVNVCEKRLKKLR